MLRSMNLHSSVLRFAHRLFLCLGIAILVHAGGTAAYAVVDQRYQLREFQHALVTATRRHPEHHFAAARVVQSFVTEEVSDLREGDVVGKLEVPRIGIDKRLNGRTRIQAIAHLIRLQDSNIPTVQSGTAFLSRSTDTKSVRANAMREFLERTHFA